MADEAGDDDEGDDERFEITVPDLYAILGVRRESSPEEIERAAELWLVEAQAFGASEEEVRAVLGAYLVLSDPLRRVLYDALTSTLRLAEWLSERWVEEGRRAAEGEVRDSPLSSPDRPAAVATPLVAAPDPPTRDPQDPAPVDWSVLRPTSEPPSPDAGTRVAPDPAPDGAIVPVSLPPRASTTYSYTRRELTRAVEVFEAVPLGVETTRRQLERRRSTPRAAPPRPTRVHARDDRGRAGGVPPFPVRPTRAPPTGVRWRSILVAMCAMAVLIAGVPRIVDVVSARDELIVGSVPAHLVAALPCEAAGDGPAAATRVGRDGDRWVAELPLDRPEGDGPIEVTVAMTGDSAVLDANGDDVTVGTTIRWRRSLEPVVHEPAGVDRAVVHARADFRRGELRLSWPAGLHGDPDGHRWRVEYRADGITTTCRAPGIVRWANMCSTP